MRHFTKIAEGVDVVPLLNALSVRRDLWNQNSLRTTHALSPHQQTDDIWCMFNRIPDDAAEVIDDVEVVPYPAWFELPIRPLVLDLMRRVDGHRLGRVLISRLGPGCTIPEHVDQGAPATYYERYHLALQSHPGAMNHSGRESVNYRMGEMWWFDNTAPHSIVNNSTDDRICLVMDVRSC
jgi:hypothetical protein